MEDPLSFAQIFCDELRQLRPDLVPPAETEKNIRDRIDQSDRPLSALCLSGGGIRSAAFALGILQGLARFRLAGKFDYLSTVSGGGYIGSWLSAWRYRIRHNFHLLNLPGSFFDALVYRYIDRTRSGSGKEAPEITGLRADSNYLTPKLGLLSADTWTVIALCIRNIVLNWSVFLPIFMGLLFVPRIFAGLNETFHGSSGSLAWPIWVGLAAVTAGLAVCSYGRRSGALGDGGFILAALAPILLAAVAFTAEAATPNGAPTLCHAAAAGAACYLLAWIVATPFVAWRTDGPPGGPPTPFALLLDAGAWLAAGALSGLALGAGMRLASVVPSEGATWLTVFGATWTMLSIFGGELVYIGLRSYARRGDMDREWLGRADGWLSAAAASWALIAAVALFADAALGKLHVLIATALAGGVSGLFALIFGGSARTVATQATQASRYLSFDSIVSLAGLVFALFLAMCISWLDARLQGALRQSAVCSGWCAPWMADCAAAVSLLLIGGVTSFAVNVNRFSLHAIYRNRLIRAFLGSARARADPARASDRFTGFDPADNLPMAELPTEKPLHVINITLNLVGGRNLAWQERKAEPFSVTPLAVGNPDVGYRPTALYGGRHGGITLGTAMAISGAAVSPNMGYHSSPIIGMLLMLFNIRLGWWLGNPKQDQYRREGPTFSAVPLFQELAGQTTNARRWVYLSDGGHFENLGLYEMVRRRCRIIVVSDAGCDPNFGFEDLANAARKIYIDLGVSIDFETMDLTQRQSPPQPAAYCALGRITYPGRAGQTGWILYIKPGYHGNEPIDIQGYANAHETFPHESTADQFFSESQFEAYRGLGAHIMELICTGGARLPPTARPAEMGFEALQAQAERYLASAANAARPARNRAGPGGLP